MEAKAAMMKKIYCEWSDGKIALELHLMLDDLGGNTGNHPYRLIFFSFSFGFWEGMAKQKDGTLSLRNYSWPATGPCKIVSNKKAFHPNANRPLADNQCFILTKFAGGIFVQWGPSWISLNISRGQGWALWARLGPCTWPPEQTDRQTRLKTFHNFIGRR